MARFLAKEICRSCNYCFFERSVSNTINKLQAQGSAKTLQAQGSAHLWFWDGLKTMYFRQSDLCGSAFHDHRVRLRLVESQRTRQVRSQGLVRIFDFTRVCWHVLVAFLSRHHFPDSLPSLISWLTCGAPLSQVSRSRCDQPAWIP